MTTINRQQDSPISFVDQTPAHEDFVARVSAVGKEFAFAGFVVGDTIRIFSDITRQIAEIQGDSTGRVVEREIYGATIKASPPPAIHVDNGLIKINEQSMVTGRIYEIQTSQGPFQLVKGDDEVVTMYEIYDVDPDWDVRGA